MESLLFSLVKGQARLAEFDIYELNLRRTLCSGR